MVVAPGTNVRILHNVPLDTTYNHTIYFASLSAQSSYFSGLTKHALVNYTYQRTTPNKIRVGVNAENLYDCNYLMWQNSSFGDKWFYAFIVSVEYINNQCSELMFEMDVIQTWLFDHSVNQCFVDRCHTGSDLIGEHIEPESVELGEYVLNNANYVDDLVHLTTIIAIADAQGTNSDTGSGSEDQDPGHGPGVEGDGTSTTAETRSVARAGVADGNFYDNVYGGCSLYAYRTAVDINDLISQYIAQPEAIVDIYTAPYKAVGYNGLIDTDSAKTWTISVDGVLSTDKLDGYTPHNCKLYTYPYNFLHVDNASGSSLALRYEFFDGNPVLKYHTKVTQPIIVTLRPYNYKGSSGDSTTECLELKNYPQCSWSMDSYKIWVAQNKFEIATTVFNAIAGTVGGVASAGPVGGVIAGSHQLSSIQNLLAQNYKASIAADICRGSAGGGNANCSSSMQTFNYGRASITKEYAKMIDNYFDIFGYHVGDVRPYFRNARPHWTYIKTVGVTITGSVPADDMQKICQIYDNGITWWKEGSEVGNYSLDNRATVRG